MGIEWETREEVNCGICKKVGEGIEIKGSENMGKASRIVYRIEVCHRCIKEFKRVLEGVEKGVEGYERNQA